MSEVFELQGTEQQQGIVREALARCDYPFERLMDGLRAQTDRERIPVEWADLSRYLDSGAGASVYNASTGIDVHHVHHPVRGEGHVLYGRPREDARHAALGLAWYEGRISIEQSLTTDPLTAQYVFLAEGAHMVDFFAMTPEQRYAVFVAYHPGEEDIAQHNVEHGWFEETGNNDYWSWVGESLMDGFIAAFSDFELWEQAPWAHPTTDAIGEQVRAILLGEPSPPGFFGLVSSSVFHDRHGGIRDEQTWPSYDAAVQADRRPCKVCKPVRIV